MADNPTAASVGSLWNALLGILTTAFLAIVGWAFNLESRMTILTQKHEDLRELINSRFDGSDGRLDRIERSLNGALHRDP